MFEEYEVVALTVALPKDGLWVGDVGTILEINDEDTDYRIDFTTGMGSMVALINLSPDPIRALNRNDKRTVRLLSPSP